MYLVLTAAVISFRESTFGNELNGVQIVLCTECDRRGIILTADKSEESQLLPGVFVLKDANVVLAENVGTKYRYWNHVMVELNTRRSLLVIREGPGTSNSDRNTLSPAREITFDIRTMREKKF